MSDCHLRVCVRHTGALSQDTPKREALSSSPAWNWALGAWQRLWTPQGLCFGLLSGISACSIGTVCSPLTPDIPALSQKVVVMNLASYRLLSRT